MDLSFTPEQEAFRAEMRQFIATAMPPHLRKKADVDGHFEMDEIMEWHKILHAKGCVAPHWPTEVGGPGWDAAQRFIFGEELEKLGLFARHRRRISRAAAPLINAIRSHRARRMADRMRECAGGACEMPEHHNNPRRPV